MSDDAALHAKIVASLSDATTYPDQPQSVDVVETHVSQVFLTDQFVYKLKKPVRLAFVDFSTAELREAACRDELRLNRRMAPNAYLDVLPITLEADNCIAIKGSGSVVDWVVHMRRLPADRMLDRLILSTVLTSDETAGLANYLADYYVAASPLAVSEAVYLTALTAHVIDNWETLTQTADVDAAQVGRIHAAQLRLLRFNPELLGVRVREERIIDGHGDLRPEHICLTDPPAVFDCVEFSADFRRVDVVDELCFLAMECDLLGAPHVGEAILEAYSQRSGDRPPPRLIAFYKSYRACVRAKVAALRGGQVVGKSHDAQQRLEHRYLDLADEEVRRAGIRPLLIVIGGLMGTGKSTLARSVGAAMRMEVLRTDAIRNEVFPKSAVDSGFNEDRYQPQARRRVYDEILLRAANRLTSGLSVVLDGTFIDGESLDRAQKLADDRGADFAAFECVCPREVSLARIEERRRTSSDPSEARPELYDKQAASRQASPAVARVTHIDGTRPLAEQIGHVIASLPEP